MWESAMFVGRENLTNLVAIVDCNGYGATPSNRPTTDWDWDDFGWDHLEVDGHDLTELRRELLWYSNRPMLIKAKTVKGRGISFMTDAPLWHGCAPTGEWVEKARQELYA